MGRITETHVGVAVVLLLW